MGRRTSVMFVILVSTLFVATDSVWACKFLDRLFSRCRAPRSCYVSCCVPVDCQPDCCGPALAAISCSATCPPTGQLAAARS